MFIYNFVAWGGFYENPINLWVLNVINKHVFNLELKMTVLKRGRKKKEKAILPNEQILISFEFSFKFWNWISVLVTNSRNMTYTIVLLIDFNPSLVILCLKLRKLRVLYIFILYFCMVVSKKYFYINLYDIKYSMNWITMTRKSSKHSANVRWIF